MEVTLDVVGAGGEDAHNFVSSCDSRTVRLKCGAVGAGWYFITLSQT
jgi:hypothetical protein